MRLEQLLERLDAGWRGLAEAYAGMSEAEMTRPGVAGAWSLKDVLAHVTTWEDEALKYLPAIAAGERTPRYRALYGGIDAFNARMEASTRELSLADVLRQLEATHARLVEYVRGVPEEQFATDTRFRRRLRWDTWHHFGEHAKAIREWRG
jgi:hypothetical protein